jgi:SepF-like predicted cell division protein (DUF552 family)
MRDFFLQLKERLAQPEMPIVNEPVQEVTGGYVELGVTNDAHNPKDQVMVRPFVLDDFEDIKQILDVLRHGKTIALVNIKPLKERDIVELKRAVNKLRKTCEAIDGDIAGFGEDYIVAVPYFARIHRNQVDQ